MKPQIVHLLRLPGEADAPRLQAFETRAERVITGALVAASGASWAPLRDGVVAMSEARRGPAPACASDLAEQGIARPLFCGHRDWDAASDPALARVPFSAPAGRLAAAAQAASAGLRAGGALVVTGDESGWAAMAVAALLPDRQIIGVFDADGALGLAGCRRWLSASDGAANLTAVVTAGQALPLAAGGVAIIDLAALAPDGAADPAPEGEARHLHVLVDPTAPVDLNRARIGERLLSEDETKVLYWAGRAASVWRTAERMGRDAAQILAVIAPLRAEGHVRVERLPAAATRLNVFWATGETLLPLAEQTLGAVARYGFGNFSDRTFARIAGEDARITYGEAARLIARTAAALHRDGVRAGDRVCTSALPHFELPLIFWACVHLGAVLVQLSSLWTQNVTAQVLRRCRPKVLFVHDEVAGRVAHEWRANAIRLDPAGETADPEARQAVFSDWLGAESAAEVPAAHAGPDEAAAILFTSGSTGVPKAVALSNIAVAVAGMHEGRILRQRHDDVSFTVVEAVAIGALRHSFVAPVMSGSSIVVADPARRGNILGIAEICRSYGVTIFRTFPSALRQLAKLGGRLPPGTFDTVRVMLAGAAPLHQQTLDALASIFAGRVMDAFGSNEAGSVVYSDPSVKRGSVFARGGVVCGAVVQTLGEDGEVLRDGEIGELRTYCERGMSGYLDDPERTAEVVKDGWLHFGDMARWEPPDGPLRIAGRAVDVIKSAYGDKVFPSEIEAVLMSDKRVGEAVACGFADRDGTERIAVFIIPVTMPPEHEHDRVGEDFKSRVRDALGDSKVPAYVRLVDDLPRLARGKVNKRELVKRYVGPMKAAAQ